MTDSIIQTVNVSSATSPHVLNSDGELLAEIDMQLPSNLISTEGVRKAEMSVMKMSVPLCKIPQVEVTIDPNAPINYSYIPSDVRTLQTNLLGTIIVADKDHVTGEIRRKWGDVPTCLFNYDELQYCAALTGVEGAQQSSMEPRILKQKEVEKGYHNFQSINDFISFFNSFLLNIIKKNVPLNTSDIPNIYLELNANNTLSLKCFPVINSDGNFFIPYARNGLDPYSRSPKSPYLVKTSGDGGVTWEPFVADTWSSVFFMFNRAVVDLMPILPWIKVRKGDDLLSGVNIWDDDYYYILDTSDTKIEVDQMNLETFNSRNAPYFFQRTSLISYHFLESQAISLSNISSILVMMRGAAFNQPVHPVNFKNTTDPTQAQTSIVPIIEVYYPFWTSTADATADLIISKTNFLDSLPIRISPNLLKERNIRFKLYYLTKTGFLREVIIPFSKTFSMQIAFSLTI